MQITQIRYTKYYFALRVSVRKLVKFNKFSLNKSYVQLRNKYVHTSGSCMRANVSNVSFGSREAGPAW